MASRFRATRRYTAEQAAEIIRGLADIAEDESEDEDRPASATDSSSSESLPEQVTSDESEFGDEENGSVVEQPASFDQHVGGRDVDPILQPAATEDGEGVQPGPGLGARRTTRSRRQPAGEVCGRGVPIRGCSAARRRGGGEIPVRGGGAARRLRARNRGVPERRASVDEIHPPGQEEDVDGDLQPLDRDGSDDEQPIVPDVPRGGAAARRGRGRGRAGRVIGSRLVLSSTLSTLQVGDKISGTAGSEWTVIRTGDEHAGRRAAQNVLREVNGPSPNAKRNVDVDISRSAWGLFVTSAMLRHIKRCTEVRAREVTGDENWTVSLDELDALIGVLYARGLYGARGINKKVLWSRDWGPRFFHATMARNRFSEIMQFLRFDIRRERAVRLANDKFALVSDVWDPFIENCKSHYRPGPNLTVDEQLLPSKCRCPFTQYMPNKPDKFGIKFWVLADSETKYMCNAFPYLGADEERPPNVQLGEHVVMKLAEPYLKKGRNVTTDNFFTTLQLGLHLKQKQTSLVGTMNRKRKEVPVEVKVAVGDLHSTTLLQNGDSTMTVYQGKRNKNVIVLSTMHPTVCLNEGNKQLPESIEYYNKTKAGVDSVDQMCRLYSTRSATRRWPVHVFFNILDFAGINAWITYKECTGVKISRHKFLRKLAEELGEKNQAARSAGAARPVDLDAAVPPKCDMRRKCQVKEICKGNKTSMLCMQCGKPTFWIVHQ